MLIRVGNMVKVKGVNGHAFVKEIIWCAVSKRAVFNVEIYLYGEFKAPPMLIVEPDDCTLYKAKTSRASKIYATPYEHEHAALMLQAA